MHLLYPPPYPLPCREGRSLKLALSLLFLLLHHAAWIIGHAQSRPLYTDPGDMNWGFQDFTASSLIYWVISWVENIHLPIIEEERTFPLTQKIWLLFLFSITVDQGPMLRPVPKRKIPCWAKLFSPNLYLLKPSLFRDRNHQEVTEAKRYYKGRVFSW